LKIIKVNKRIISIDCGTAIVGWAILEAIGNKYIHIDSGAIRTKAKTDMALRLRTIFEELNRIINLYKPIQMAVEDLFYFKNKKTVISVSQAKGVIMLAGSINELPVYVYTPLQVKIALTGYGRAEKKQVESMIMRILNLETTRSVDDIADAIAVGICHLNYIKL
jgi:crossover junction endodeoxyribonuclease RuvC